MRLIRDAAAVSATATQPLTILLPLERERHRPNTANRIRDCPQRTYVMAQGETSEPPAT